MVSQFFSKLIVNLLIAVAVIISIIAIPLSLAAFLFVAATSSSDPNEQHEPLIMFVVMVGVIGGIVAGWIVYLNRQRSRPRDEQSLL